MTDELITVASSAPMAMLIHDVLPNPDPDKPGIRSDDSIVINGTGHPDAVGGLGITHGVNASWFANWMKAHPHLEGILHPMTPDEFKAHAEKPVEFGFEPGLAKLADDKDNAELASKGTEFEQEHPHADAPVHTAAEPVHAPVEQSPVVVPAHVAAPEPIPPVV